MCLKKNKTINETKNETSSSNEESLEQQQPVKNKKKHPKLKFLVYFLLIIVLTGLALFLSLYQDFDGVINAIKRCDWRILLIILGLITIVYCIEGFIVFVFSRLYTREYKYHQGAATAMIGAFYSAVTPGASGGQIMQVYTMKKQGVETSNAASIMIMSFIVYQAALILLGVIGVFFQWDLISSIGSFQIANLPPIPALPFTIIGFVVNVSVILMLFLMSYSHGIHNFIMHYGIGLLAKLRILKKPDKTRETLRIQVENFKIELRRLLSNIPVTILVFLAFSIILIIKFSIPYFAGIALDGYGYLVNIDGSLIVRDGLPVLSTGQLDFKSFWDSVFLSSYHQMATGLIPLPGAAGVSEYFFNIIFANYFTSQQVTTAAQIIWRFSTFHVVLLVSGLVSALYRASPKEQVQHANRKTFVTLQLETYQSRKESSDTLFETASLSRHEVREKLKNFGKKNNRRDYNEVPEVNAKNTKQNTKQKRLEQKNSKQSQEDKWTNIKAGDDE